MIFVFVVLARTERRKGDDFASDFIEFVKSSSCVNVKFYAGFGFNSLLVYFSFHCHHKKLISWNTTETTHMNLKKMRFVWLNICVDICCCLSRRRQLGEAFKCFSTVLTGLEIISIERLSRRSLFRFLRTRKEWKGISNLSFNPTHKRMKTRERTKKRVKIGHKFMIAKINTFCWILKSPRMHLKQRENENVLIEPFNFIVTFCEKQKSDDVWMKCDLGLMRLEFMENKYQWFLILQSGNW